MEHATIITSVLSQVYVPAGVVEDIVNHRTRKTKYNFPLSSVDLSRFTGKYDTIVTYSIQSSVKGYLQIESYNNRSGMIETRHLPASGSFLLTCIKGKGDKYKLQLCSSLN